MRVLPSLLLAICVGLSAFAERPTRSAEASFHCMRIHAVMSGVSGNPDIQYVELRMDFAGQSALTNHTMQFFDATGTLKATFTFPSGVPMGATGESILVATSEFNSIVVGGAADFVFTNANTVGSNGGDPLHPVQALNGSVVWGPAGTQCGIPGPVDDVAYGGATALFGTAAVALPANGGTRQALRLSNLAVTPTNNSTEYSLQNISNSTFSVALGSLPSDFTTPRNNSRVVLQIGSFPPGVGGIAEGASPRAPAATSSTTGGGPGAGGYALAGGVAATAIAAGAGWYVYRRRAP